MARGNFVHFEGNAIRHEHSYTPSGRGVSKLTVVWGRDKNVAFVTVTVWNPSEKLVKQLDKAAKKNSGILVSVEGRLRTENWESNGQKRSRLTVTADSIGFVLFGSFEKQEEGGQKQTRKRAKQQEAEPEVDEEEEVDEDDTPF